MLYFSVNDELCNRCGLCVQDCPSAVIKQNGDAVPAISRKDSLDCIGCQHCLAICPTAAISIFKRKPEHSLPLDRDSLPTFEQMNLLLRGRRAVRSYKDENVKPELIQQLLAAVAHAPSGVNRHSLTFSVIDNKAAMQKFRERAVAGLLFGVPAIRYPRTVQRDDAAVVRRITID